MSISKMVYRRKDNQALTYFGVGWPSEALERVDEARKTTYENRSRFILRLVTEHLNETEKEEGEGKTSLLERPPRLGAKRGNSAADDSAGDGTDNGRWQEVM